MLNLVVVALYSTSPKSVLSLPVFLKQRCDAYVFCCASNTMGLTVLLANLELGVYHVWGASPLPPAYFV